MPDQKKVNFHHWVGMLVHRGARMALAERPLDAASAMHICNPSSAPWL